MEVLEKKIPSTDGKYSKFIPHEGSETLAIIFSTVGVKPGYFTFYKSMLNIPVHKLHLTDPHSEWFQDGIPGFGKTVEETVESIKALQESIGAKEIVTIGSSMGGYGALLYGALLNCRVLSFGARVQLGTPGSQSFHLAKKGYSFKYKDLTNLIEQSSSNILLYQGETDYNDMLAAYDIGQLSNVNCVSIKGVAHATPVFLNQKYGIAKVIQTFVDKEPIVDFPERGELSNSKKTLEMYFKGLRFIEEQSNEEAIKVLEAILLENEDRDAIHHKLGIVYYKEKEYDKALYHQKRAVEISPHFSNAQHQYGICLRKAGQYEESYHAHCLAYKLDPKQAGAHHHAGLSLEKLERFDEAENEFRMAHKLATKNTNYKLKFIERLKENIDAKNKELAQLVK